MKYLIDTHILIWHGENNPALKPSILSAINHILNDNFIGHVSNREMAT